jgi:hypothetical protein
MMNMVKKQFGGVTLLIGLLFISASCPAHETMNEFKGLKVVADRDLDTMRGGFVSSGGLEISLGIVKAVFVDGVLQTTSTLNIPRLGELNGVTPMQISNLHSNSAAFVQNTGNQIVIQNGANQKIIQSMTVVNATVNSISLLRDINLMSRINQQLVNVLH